MKMTGGRVTDNVIKIGNTVHRPLKNNSEFVHKLLKDLEEKGRAVEEERRIAKEREQYVIKRFAEISRLTPSQKDAMKNKDNVLRSLESDITSGKYSPAEVQKMMNLWKNLQ